MEPPDLPSNDLPEGTGDNRFVQNIAQHLRIVNILRPLPDAEHCDFLWQVRCREQCISLSVRWNWCAIIRIALCRHIAVSFGAVYVRHP